MASNLKVEYDIMKHRLVASCGPFGTRCDMQHFEQVVLCPDCKQTPMWCICLKIIRKGN